MSSNRKPLVTAIPLEDLKDAIIGVSQYRKELTI